MTLSNIVKTDFSTGSLDPALHGRTDLPLYKKAIEVSQNFYTEIVGPARYRPGFRFVHPTRRGNLAWYVPFQYNDEESYLIEVTDGYFRFYRNEAIITETAQNITGITAANPGVVTIASHGYSDGDEVVIESVGGMVELNNRSFLVTNSTASTFELTDYFGTVVDTSGYTAYTSGGTASKIYEIKTPYEEDYIAELQFTQNANLMYINHRRYESRQLTRTSHTSWTLERYTRTNEPFQAAQDISGITQADPAVVTYSGADTFSNGDQIYIDNVVGMTEVNDQHYLIANVNTGANTFELQDLDSNDIDSTGYTAYTSDGKIEKIAHGAHPRAVAFTDDTRIVHAGSSDNPETMWFSRGPDAGTTRLDDFTTGSDDTDAATFTLAPIHGKADVIQWLTYSDRFLLAGTFGTIRRIYGATEADPITPTSITAKSSNVHGTKIGRPATNGPLSFYIQRGGRNIRSYEYDFSIDGYFPVDRNLLNDRILRKGAERMVDQRDVHDHLWVVLGDGKFAGHTYNAKEKKAAWHAHKLGGPTGKILDFGSMPRTSGYDQLWAIVEWTLTAGTLRAVCFLEDIPDYPQRDDFLLDPDDEAGDTTKFLNAMFELQKDGMHLDGASTYDGSGLGGTMTPGTGADTVGTTGVTFTASESVFTSDMVGREIWKAFDEDGAGGGRAEITAFTSATSVDCTIKEAFDTTAAIVDGSWYLTTDTVTGLWLFEGETVNIVKDGSPHKTATVTDGSVSTDTQGSIIHVGFQYLGYFKTVASDQGGVTGSAVNKPKNVAQLLLRVLDTATGFEFGTSFYNLVRYNLRGSSDITSRPVPLTTGLVEQVYPDGWERDKHIYIVQRNPSPLTILTMDIVAETTDEQ